VRHAHFARAELLGQVGGAEKLVGGGVARRLAQALED
jgi:hypothetical protein